MICVTSRHFEYLNRYEKSATSRGSMRKVMTSSDSARQGLSNDIGHVPSFWIFNEIRKIGDMRRFDGGKWWSHQTLLCEGFRMICVTYRHFEYLIRYEKSATSGGSIRKVMTSWESSRPGLSNDMRRVPPFWIFNQIKKIGDIRRFDAESDYVIGLSLESAFEWYGSRAFILNI